MISCFYAHIAMGASKYIQKTHDGLSKTENRGAIFNFQLAGQAGLSRWPPPNQSPFDNWKCVLFAGRPAGRVSVGFFRAARPGIPRTILILPSSVLLALCLARSLSLRFIVVIMKRDKDINNTAVSVRVPHVVVTLLFVYASRRDVLT